MSLHLHINKKNLIMMLFDILMVKINNRVLRPWISLLSPGSEILFNPFKPNGISYPYQLDQ